MVELRQKIERFVVCLATFLPASNAVLISVSQNTVKERNKVGFKLTSFVNLF